MFGTAGSLALTLRRVQRFWPTVLLILVVGSAPAWAQLGDPPVPDGNPLTPEKTILGKILFWDEQLSSDNTVACGTCHLPEIGGADLRNTRTAGFDNTLFTDDDGFGSPGIRTSDSGNNYSQHSLRGFQPQITPRNSPPFISSQYFTTLFWDGRAANQFLDPLTQEVSLEGAAALESQALDPILSPVEMGHEGRDWPEVLAKLENIIPLKLASDLTPDIVDALAIDPTYSDLFQRAFGDPTPTPVNIAFALASYQRSLVPDQTPWDDFMRGDASALTRSQQEGLTLFNTRALCHFCHVGEIFSDQIFHNTGLRPAFEDIGFEAVTLDPLDRGKFKTSTLRNVGLRKNYMHNGQFTSLRDILKFYNRGGDFTENQDGLMKPLGLSLVEQAKIIDFIETGLTDPRVQHRLPPFDRPTLHSEIPATKLELYGTGSTGSGNMEPRFIAASPPSIANPDFKLGIHRGLAGAPAILVISSGIDDQILGGIPLHVDLDQEQFRRTLKLTGAGPGTGFATFKAAIPNSPDLIGSELFAQWFVRDPEAPGGFAATAGLRIELF